MAKEMTSLFISELAPTVTEFQLFEVFNKMGQLFSILVCREKTSQKSLGYGFADFLTHQAASRALDERDKMYLNGKSIRVMYSNRNSSFCNLFVKNDEELHQVFLKFGSIISSVIMRDSEGKSKGFGFVNLKNSDDAARAVEALNGKRFGDTNLVWYVMKAQNKSERDIEHKQSKLYVKNLDEDVTDDTLRQLFSTYGIIREYKVMRYTDGESKGFGFVSFATPEEASEAMEKMNGKMVYSKPIFVCLANQEEDIQARLQADYMPPAVGPRMPISPPMMPMIPQIGSPWIPMIPPASLPAVSSWMQMNRPDSPPAVGSTMQMYRPGSLPAVGTRLQMYPPGSPPLVGPRMQMYPPGSPPLVGPRMQMYPPGSPPVVSSWMQMYRPGSLPGIGPRLQMYPPGNPPLVGPRMQMYTDCPPPPPMIHQPSLPMTQQEYSVSPRGGVLLDSIAFQSVPIEELAASLENADQEHPRNMLGADLLQLIS